MGKSYANTILPPIAIFSMICSSLVVLTALVFPEMIRNKIFMQLVVLISATDILGNWTYALGYVPENGSVLCNFQGFCGYYFYACNWLLTMMLTVLFRDLVVHRRVSITRMNLLVVCFIFPLLLGLLLLTTNTYGTEPNQNDAVCLIGGNKHTQEIWHEALYTGLLIACQIIMVLVLLHILYFERVNPQLASTSSYKLVRKLLILYPLAMLLCWTPHTVCDFVASCETSTRPKANVNAFKIVNGAVVALIFFWQSPLARQKWLMLVGLRQSYTSTNQNLLSGIVESSAESIKHAEELPEDIGLVPFMTNGATTPGQRNSTLNSRGSESSQSMKGTGIEPNTSGSVQVRRINNTSSQFGVGTFDL